MSDGAYQLGFEAKSVFDNPYWSEYPSKSKLGYADECNARIWVDGYVAALRLRLLSKGDE